MVEKTDPKNLLWCEKYRPNKIDDCILPERLKDTFKKFVEKNEVPNLLLTGSAGTGKTTVAKALCHELDIDFLEINGSMSGNIDTLRVEIQNFASTVSMHGGRKVVILDEMDYLNPNSTQPALRNFMEQYSKNCGFIGTCNFKNKIIDPLLSRMSLVEFNITKKEIAALGPKFMKRVEAILKEENVPYDPKAVAALIGKHFPDCRHVLVELQTYAASGQIDSGILTDFQEERFKEFADYLKARNFTKARRWVAENEDISTGDFYRKFYDTASDMFAKESIPQLVLHLQKYMLAEATIVDFQVNRAAFSAEVMADCQFKE
jgi:DNA polymerase III delta prime subunit